MKNVVQFLCLFLLTFASSYSNAQYINIDFEASGAGAGYAWTMDQNGTNPPLAFVANPNASGINTSATVAEFTAEFAGQPWALTFTDDVPEFQFDGTNSTVTIMVYKPVISPIGLKFEGSSPAVEILVSNTLVNQWEEITFDFSGQIGNTYNRFVVIPDFDFTPRAQDNTLWFDNISYPEANVAAPLFPMVAAPTPTHDEIADNVLSIFSDTYTNVAGTDFDPFWGQLTDATQEPVAGNNTLKYFNLNYQGTQFTAQDVSGHGYLHVDFWTENASNLEFYLISQTTGERLVSLPITTEEWVSVDIPLHQYVSQGLGLNDIFQFKVVGNGTVWFDNWYFHGDYFEPTPMVAAPEPSLPSEDVISMFSDVYTDVTVDTWATGWSPGVVLSDIQIEGNNTKLYSGLQFVGIETIGDNSIDASAMNTFHIDVWTGNMTTFRVKLVDFGADGQWQGAFPDTEHEITFTNFPQETWVSLEIPLADFAGLGSTSNIAQLILSGAPTGSVYIDNVYFSFIHEPSLLCRQPISTNASLGLCGREDLVILDPFFIDPSNIGGGVITHNAPAFYPTGTTMVTWTLTNDDGSVSTCEQEISISDTEAPVVGTCNTIYAFIAENSCFATVVVDPVITDNCGVASISGTGTFSFESGSYSHPVTIMDVNGNETVHIMSIEVHDGNAPTFFNCPEEEIVLTSPSGGNVNYPAAMMPFATDNCGGASLSNDLAADGLPVGSSIVTFIAIDDYGNSSACIVDVFVEGEPDMISLHPANSIEASLADNETSQVVSWNPLDAATQCEYCEETDLEGFTFVGTYWGHQYFLANEVSLTRQDAQLLAEGYDSHLAVISSAGENTFLKEALSNEVRTAWIGLMPQLENEEWTFAWDNAEANEFSALVLDMNEINEDTRIVLSQDGNWISATNAEEKYFLIERPCVDFSQVGPLVPNSTSELLRSGDSWPEGAYEVTYAVVDMCGNESELTFDVTVQPEIAEFCTTVGTDNGIWIEGVTFHEMTNISTSNDGYADFSAQTVSMNIGDGVVLLDLTAGGNTDTDVLYWRVWLDKNNDGDFFDANEVLFEQSTENGHVQANLALDQENIEASRLRVAVARHAFPAPCGNPYVGEIEDYSLTLYAHEQIDFNNEREAQIGINPNPANTYVNVDLVDFSGEDVVIRIFDVSGKSMIPAQNVVASSSPERVELRNLTNGLYFLNVSAGERMVTKRLVISNISGSTTSAK